MCPSKSLTDGPDAEAKCRGAFSQKLTLDTRVDARSDFYWLETSPVPVLRSPSDHIAWEPLKLYSGGLHQRFTPTDAAQAAQNPWTRHAHARTRRLCAPAEFFCAKFLTRPDRRSTLEPMQPAPPAGSREPPPGPEPYVDLVAFILEPNKLRAHAWMRLFAKVPSCTPTGWI